MKILIVDDSELLQERLKNALLKVAQNLFIAQAYSCQEAMELFKTFGPDSVILDIALPDGSGINLLQHFKEDRPTVNVIMLTNYPITEFKNRCMELGANQFFDKSNLSVLIKSIKCNNSILN